MKAPGNKQDSTDVLLMLGGLVVAGVGVSWLLLSKPWESFSSEPRAVGSPVVVETARSTVEPRAPQPSLESTLDNPLRMARLAFEAGMLVEPAGYSAWSLYEQVLEETPDQPEALNGLTLIADSLVARAAVALEQGRLADARAIVERIQGTLPGHDGAAALAAELGAPPPPVRREEPVVSAPPAPTVVEAKPAPVAIVAAPRILETPPVEEPPPPPPAIDPLVELQEAFANAMADNRLLAPADDNALHFLDAMIAIDSAAAPVTQAQRNLFDELLRRASAATASLDAVAASAWIDAADSVLQDPRAIEGARSQLRTRQIEAESRKPFPASQLEIVEYVAPRYPMRALTRNLDGWVDVEFFVTTEGTTRDVVVTDASHDTYFREQAVAAVERWLFEPRIFLGEPIEQRVYTRIRFDFQ